MTGIHSGHRARMRSRFVSQGLEGFAEHEVLELVLFYAIPQRDVNPLAHKLLDHFGSLHRVMEAEQQELMQVEGVGEYAATLIRLFGQMGARIRQSRKTARTRLRNQKEARDYCMQLLEGKRKEHFYLVCMNGEMEVVADALVASGSLDEVAAYPRLVAELALRHDAHTVVLCHNHPDGKAYPSQDDLDTTASLNDMLQRIGVVLADHIIVAGEASFSLAANRFITREITEDSILTHVASSAGETRIPRLVDEAKKNRR